MARKVKLSAKDFQSSENLDDLIDLIRDGEDTGVALLSSIIENPAHFEPIGLIAIGAQSVSAVGAAIADADVAARADIGSAPPLGLNQTDADPPAAPGPPATLQTLASYLTDGFWGAGEFGGGPRHFNLTNSGTGANSGVINYNVTGFSGLAGAGTDTDGISAARQATIRNALDMYEDVLGINFVEVTGQADAVDLYFKDNASGAFANSVKHAGSTNIDYSYINIEPGWDGGGTAIGSYSFQTAMHEIGHALGLGHQGNYNAGAGTPTYATSARWQNDSWQATMMSYWDQFDNTYIDASFAFLVSPMSVDWIALNSIYGGMGYGVSNAFAGNTTWGFNTTISASNAPPIYNTSNNAFSQLATLAATYAFTIVDGSGIDTLDFSGFSASQLINLAASSGSSISPSISNIGGLIGNMTIAEGTVIENAIGGSGSDTLNGNSADNTLRGNGGNDTMDGGAGTDFAVFSGVRSQYTLTALAGNGVRVVGPDGTDTLTNIERLVFSDRTEVWPDVPMPPVITSNGGGDTATFTIREARTAVTWVTATDPNPGTVLTYSIIGGADAAKFAINSATGALVLLTAADFENPTDAGNNNSYVVQVRVSDGALTDSQTLTVNIANIREDRKQPPDFNADFQSDLLWRNNNGELASWEMNLGGWGGGQSFGVQQAQWKVAGFGDFNGDGTTDLLWRHDNGQVDTWQLKNGGYNGGQTFGVHSQQWQIEGLGDFNGDGTTDLLWRHASGQIDTWEMKNGGYSGGKTFGVHSLQWQVVGLGDFNGDGSTDLLWRHDSGRVDTWEMKNGAYAGGKTFGDQPVQWKPIGFGDFNGDGTTDMLWRHDDGRVATWQMNNGGYGGGVDFGPMPNAWEFLRTGDFNGDGTSDILWRNSITGQLDTWEMRNGGYGGGQHLGAISNDWHIQV